MARRKALPILRYLADLYGAKTPFDYVSDCWGSTECSLTPTEVIAMHKQFGWTDDNYGVYHNAKPGEAVLYEHDTRNPILVVPR